MDTSKRQDGEPPSTSGSTSGPIDKPTSDSTYWPIHAWKSRITVAEPLTQSVAQAPPKKCNRYITDEEYKTAIAEYDNAVKKSFERVGKKYGIPKSSLAEAYKRFKQGLPIRSTKKADNRKITDDLIRLVQEEVSRRTAEGSIPLAFFDGEHDYTKHTKGSLFCSVEFASIVEKIREYILLKRTPEEAQGLIKNKARKPLGETSYRKLAKKVGVPKTVAVGSNTQKVRRSEASADFYNYASLVTMMSAMSGHDLPTIDV